MSILASFQKTKACSQTVLPDRNFWRQNSNVDFFYSFTDVPNPTSSSKLQDESTTPNWIRRSFETLLEEKSNNSVTTTLTLSQSTGNLAEVLKKSETELKSSETRSSIELEKE